MSTLDVDLDRVIVWGSSAGGGLAAAIALMARDKGGPALAHQMSLCPMLDDRNDTPSSHELDREGFWDRRSNLTGWTSLLGVERGGPNVSPYAARRVPRTSPACRPRSSTSVRWRRSGTRP